MEKKVRLFSALRNRAAGGINHPSRVFRDIGLAGVISGWLVFAFVGYLYVSADICFQDLQLGLEREIIAQVPGFANLVKSAIHSENENLWNAMADGVLTTREVEETSARIAQRVSNLESVSAGVHEGVTEFAKKYPIIIRTFWDYKSHGDSIPLRYIALVLVFTSLAYACVYTKRRF